MLFHYADFAHKCMIRFLGFNPITKPRLQFFAQIFHVGLNCRISLLLFNPIALLNNRIEALTFSQINRNLTG